MVLRNSLFETDVAEHIQLLLIFSAHTFFLSGRVVETRESFGTARLKDKALTNALEVLNSLL